MPRGRGVAPSAPRPALAARVAVPGSCDCDCPSSCASCWRWRALNPDIGADPGAEGRPEEHGGGEGGGEGAAGAVAGASVGGPPPKPKKALTEPRTPCGSGLSIRSSGLAGVALAGCAGSDEGGSSPPPPENRRKGERKSPSCALPRRRRCCGRPEMRSGRSFVATAPSSKPSNSSVCRRR